MADTLDITEGTGTTIATDDCAGVHYQQVKLVDGTADATTVVAVDVGVKANALRVAPANDITDGTYIGDINFGEAEPNSAAIKTAVELLDNAVDGNYLNVNVNMAGTDAAAGEGVISAQTQRVTIATDDDGVAHLATIAGDTTAIETAVQIMDDWDAVHASAAPTDGVQVMGAGYSTALPADVGADADAARLVTDRYGRLCAGLQPQAAKATLDNADTTTAREVVGAVASRKVYITAFILSVDTAGNYWFEDGDATAVSSKFYLAANGGVSFTCPEGTPLSTPTANKALNVKGSVAGNVGVTVTYYLAP